MKHENKDDSNKVKINGCNKLKILIQIETWKVKKKFIFIIMMMMIITIIITTTK